MKKSRKKYLSALTRLASNDLGPVYTRATQGMDARSRIPVSLLYVPHYLLELSQIQILPCDLDVRRNIWTFTEEQGGMGTCPGVKRS